MAFEIFKSFDSESKCRVYLESLRFPEKVFCLRCNRSNILRIGKRKQFLCKICRYQFSVISGTLFHRTHLPLLKWFNAVILVGESDGKISVLEIKDALGIAYQTAWRLRKCIETAVLTEETLPAPYASMDPHSHHFPRINKTEYQYIDDRMPDVPHGRKITLPDKIKFVRQKMPDSIRDSNFYLFRYLILKLIVYRA